VLAAAIGYGIYKGGVKLNMARFFRVTGLVLVVVAAGLVMTAFHTAYEAGWLAYLVPMLLLVAWPAGGPPRKPSPAAAAPAPAIGQPAQQ
jgi:high-affinity iron transporter